MPSNLPSNPTNPIVIEITDVAYGGSGLARRDGKVWFIPGTIPGDRVSVRVTSEKKRYVEGEVIETLESSPLRNMSPCRFQMDCGGCQWIDIPYDTQTHWKKSFIEAALNRIGQVDAVNRLEFFPSPRSLNYRNRILLRAHSHGDGLKFGYFRRKSRDLVPIDSCSIADERINHFLKELVALKISLPNDSRWRLEIQAFDQTPSITITVFPADRGTKGTEELVASLNSLKNVAWANTIFEIESAPLLPLETENSLTYHSFPGQFQQVNLAHNKNLRNLLHRHANEINPSRILDVCCGSGNLSLGLASPERYIEAVEYNKKAILAAKRNTEIGNIMGTKFIVGDSEAHLKRCVQNQESFDLVILDPPRQGMFKGMTTLMQMNPEHIFYVSCDPTTLARDVSVLTRDHTYDIVKLYGFDFFPNTYHVETFIWLRRRGSES